MALLPDKEKLLRNFLRCANWEEKYLYIIELGQRLPELRDEDRSSQNSIQGCQSQVWIVMRQNAQGIIKLQGDSDAAIVKGLIAVVFILYDQMTPQDIVNFDVRPWFEKMALTQHLTPSRSQGLEAMIRAIRAKAAALSSTKGTAFIRLAHIAGWSMFTLTCTGVFWFQVNISAIRRFSVSLRQIQEVYNETRVFAYTHAYRRF